MKTTVRNMIIEMLKASLESNSKKSLQKSLNYVNFLIMNHSDTNVTIDIDKEWKKFLDQNITI